MNSPSFNPRILIAGGLAVTLVGCVAIGPSRSPEEVVTQRAEAYWQAMIAGDAEKAYSLHAPSYRDIVPLDRYRGTMGSAVRREAAKVVAARCEEDRCSVRVRLEYTMPLQKQMGRLSTHLNQDWVREDGRWWLYRRP